MPYILRILFNLAPNMVQRYLELLCALDELIPYYDVMTLSLFTIFLKLKICFV